MKFWSTVLACLTVCKAEDQPIPLPSTTNEAACTFDPQNQNPSLTASARYTKLSTKDDCFRTCYEDTECTYVEYNEDKGKCFIYMAGDKIAAFASTVYDLKRQTTSTQCKKSVTFEVSSFTQVQPGQNDLTGPSPSRYKVEMHNPKESPLAVYIGDFLEGTRLRVVLVLREDESIPQIRVNLRTGDSQTMQERILMHFNVRKGWKILVNNYDKQWLEEEYIKADPFDMDQLLTIDFIASSDNGNKTVLIYVDGQFYYKFHQREQLTASWAEFGGEIEIHAVYVE